LSEEALVLKKSESKRNEILQRKSSSSIILQNRTNIRKKDLGTGYQEKRKVYRFGNEIDNKMKKKSESGLRWVILVLTCAVMVGNYYCYDIPASLHKQLQDYLPRNTTSMPKYSNFEVLFSLLYTVYSVPNMVLPFFGGFLVDRFGIRICFLRFVFLILLGQGIFTLGLVFKSWGIMLLGRVLFGLGGESLGVANGALLSEWFKGAYIFVRSYVYVRVYVRNCYFFIIELLFSVMNFLFSLLFSLLLIPLTLQPSLPLHISFHYSLPSLHPISSSHFSYAGKELAFAFGLNLSISRLGEKLCFLILTCNFSFSFSFSFFNFCFNIASFSRKNYLNVNKQYIHFI
jgi:MFS family permease